jgi:hypothetical protein
VFEPLTLSQEMDREKATAFYLHDVDRAVSVDMIFSL